MPRGGETTVRQNRIMQQQQPAAPALPGERVSCTARELRQRRAAAILAKQNAAHRHRIATVKPTFASPSHIELLRSFRKSGGPKRARDLAAKFEAAGLPSRYVRKLASIGVFSVAELLRRGTIVHPNGTIELDETIESLQPFPGHRTALIDFVRTEAAAAGVILPPQLRSARAVRSDIHYSTPTTRYFT